MTYLESMNDALLNYVRKNRRFSEAVVAELDQLEVDNSGGCSCSGYSVSFYIKWKKDKLQKRWVFIQIYEDPIEFLTTTLLDYIE